MSCCPSERYALCRAAFGACAAIDDLSGHKLDAIMSMGDYTSTGSSVQAGSFASATKAILDAINADKSEGKKAGVLLTKEIVIAYKNYLLEEGYAKRSILI